MIYLDCAATSMQKPSSVAMAMVEAMRTMASPGRGGHRPAMRAADTAFDCRVQASRLFGLDDPEKVIFTMNATHALNIAINSLVKRGDKVVVSGFEHNSVTRPLYALGADVRIAASPLFKPEQAVEAFARELPGAAAAVCCHVSNVFGFIMPIADISGLCKDNGVPLIIDASQSAGNIGIDNQTLGAQFIAMPGHKGLLGPQGTGLLLCRETGSPIMSGGTGSNSALSEMPDYLPDRLEAGTHNIPGIAGLLAGMRYVERKTPAAILRHERGLMLEMGRRLERLKGLKVWVAEDPTCQTGVLSVSPERISAEIMAEELGKRGVAVRSGLHCSPTAHKSAGTLESGTVRFSFSSFNTSAEVARAADITADIIKGHVERYG